MAPILCMLPPSRLPAALQGKPFVRPAGAFGQSLPQNVPSDGSSPAVRALGVTCAPDNKDFDHIGPDGLPHAGAVIWPGQVLRLGPFAM
jgi:hypothetical protein